jgi:hypothetical protein
MRIPLHGGIDIESEADLRFALALLDDPDSVERAKRARDAERAASGLVLDDDGQIVGVKES